MLTTRIQATPYTIWVDIYCNGKLIMTKALKTAKQVELLTSHIEALNLLK